MFMWARNQYKMVFTVYETEEGVYSGRWVFGRFCSSHAHEVIKVEHYMHMEPYTKMHNNPCLADHCWSKHR